MKYNKHFRLLFAVFCVLFILSAVFAQRASAEAANKDELFSIDISKKQDEEMLAKCLDRIAKNPRDTEALVDAGLIRFFYRGEYDEARKNFEAALALDPDNYWAHYGLARFHDQRGEPEKEFAHWDKVMMLDPDSPYTELIASYMPMQRLDLLRNMKFLDKKFKNPIVQYYAGMTREKMLMAEGKYEECNKMRAAEKWINDWLVIGGFGKISGAVFYTVFTPEIHIDLGAEYEGAETKVKWFRQQDYLPADYLQNCMLDKFCYSGVKYALTYVESPEEKDAVIWFQRGDRAKMWLNNNVIYETDMKHSDQPANLFLKVHLNRGWNKILVKTGATFKLRITDPEGALIPKLKTETKFAPGANKKMEAAIKPSPNVKDAPAFSALEKLLVKYSDKPGHLMGNMRLEEAALYFGYMEDAVNYAKKAAELAPLSAVNLVSLSRIYKYDATLSEVDRQNRAKRTLERAIELDEKCIDAYLNLSDLDKGRKTDDAVKTLRRLIEIAPDNAKAHFNLGKLFHDRSWYVEAEQEFLRARELQPDWLEVRKELLEFWEGHFSSFGGTMEYNKDLADKEQKFLAEHDKSYEYMQVSDMKRDGQYDKALAYYERMRKAYPYTEYFINEMMQVYRELKKYDKVLECYDELEKLNPAGEIDYLRDRADIYLKIGRRDDAIAALEKWLNSPHNKRGDVDTMHLLQELKGVKDDYYKPYEIDVEKILKDTKDIGPDNYPDAHSVMLYEQVVTRYFDIHGNGERTVHKVVKVLTEEGRTQQGSPELGEDLREIRVIMPDGKILEPDFVGGGAYLEDLKVGSVVDYSFRDRTGIRNHIGDKMALDMKMFPSDEYPIMHRKYVVIMPRELAKKLTTKIQRNLDVKPLVKEEGDLVTYTWETKDIKMFVGEPQMIPPSQVLPFILWGEPATPEMIAEALREDVSDAFVRTKFLENKAREIVKDKEGVIAKARAIYTFVMEEIREEGGGDPTLTLAERSGDRMNLAGALMEAVGIDVDIVKIRPPKIGLENIQGFNGWRDFYHTVLCIKDEKGDATFLDFSIRYNPFGKFADLFSGSEAVIVSSDAITPIIMPTPPSGQRGVHSYYTIRIDGEGEIKYSFKTVMYAESGAAWRAVRKTVDRSRLEQYIEQASNSSIPGSSISKVKLPDEKDWESPAVITFEGKAEGFAEMTPEGLSFEAVTEKLNLSKTLVRKTKRKYGQIVLGARISPLMLNPPASNMGEYKAEFIIPEGFMLESMPQNTVLMTEYGTFTLYYKLDGNKITVERSVYLPVQVVPAKGYKNFVTFCRQVDEAERNRILLVEKD